MSAIAYYITAHGYGHGARSCDVLRALMEADPARPLVIVSDLPPAFFRDRLPAGAWRHRPGSFDVGMVQHDSIRVDVEATRAACVALLERAEELERQEAAFLRSEQVTAVVCDIPAIPLRAARMADIPALAIGNFGWDWIYEEFIPRDARWRAVSEHFRAGYAGCDELLRFPFAEPMAAFPRRRELGLPARPARPRREELAALTGADPGKAWILLSFTSLDWNAEALARVTALRDWEFFALQPLAWTGPNIHPVDRRVIPFSSVLASADAVLTKPGFGVLADCAVNRKPLIYAERTDFREYPVLEAAVKRCFQHVHIPAEQLYRGELRAALEAIRIAPLPHETVAAGGDAEAARIILSYASRAVAR
ncbi:MAG TPA: hypothetical protein PKE12_05155 [Kiritimatiellia bacterium]|nr:hypothetical protein [Kiritimatiellia bacterium]